MSSFKSNIRYLNEKAELYAKIQANINNKLYLVYSKNYADCILTDDAYKALRATMDPEDLATHWASPIDPGIAGLLDNPLVTLEDLVQKADQG
jgi:hypothetical protein